MNPLEQFRSIVEPWLPAYDSLNVSVVGVRAKEERIVLTAQLALVPSVNPPNSRPALDGDVFWARHERVPFNASQFADLLTNFSVGRVLIGDIQARVPQDHQLRTPWFSPAAP